MISFSNKRVNKRYSIWGVVGGILILVLSIKPLLGATPTDWLKSDLHIKILLKALSYEYGLQKSKGSTITLGVVLNHEDKTASQSASHIMKLIKKLSSHMTFLDRKILVEKIPVGSAKAELKKAVKNVSILYFGPKLSPARIKAILAVTQPLGIISVTGVEDYMKLGLSLGAGVRQGRPKLIVNSKGAAAEGAKFSSKIMRIALILH